MKIYVLWHSYSDGADWEPYDGEGPEGYYQNIDNAKKELESFYEKVKAHKDEYIHSEICLLNGKDILDGYTSFNGDDELSFEEANGLEHVMTINTIETKD